MLSKVFSAGLKGIEAYLVDVEVDIAVGLAQWNTVGLPESSVRESRERVIGAIRNSGYDFHRRRITINLAPADIKKEGTGFDLPVAIGLLASSGLFPLDRFKGLMFVGELSLKGEVKPVRGALSIAMLAKRREAGLVLPAQNLGEAAVVKGLALFPAEALSEVVEHLLEKKQITFAPLSTESGRTTHYGVDFSEVKGQKEAKRALEVAAAGGHNLLMIGPPGAGKTMLAQRLPTILPPMTPDEAIETTQIYSSAGELNGQGPLMRERPFRAPHHVISDAGLAGGGPAQRPGETSLAHNGVLFLDELPEFHRNVLEILRQPMESGKVTLARAQATVTYPARFMLIAAMNPCRCGYAGTGIRDCVCTHQQLHFYRTKLSGPLVDRIDIQLEVPPLKSQEILGQGEGEPSAVIQGRILKAREVQQARFRGLKIFTNAQMRGRLIRQHCMIGPGVAPLLRQAVEKLQLSARAYDRILKVGRTIADLDGSEPIKPAHLAEAICYRRLDRDPLR